MASAEQSSSRMSSNFQPPRFIILLSATGTPILLVKDVCWSTTIRLLRPQPRACLDCPPKSGRVNLWSRMYRAYLQALALGFLAFIGAVADAAAPHVRSQVSTLLDSSNKSTPQAMAVSRSQ